MFCFVFVLRVREGRKSEKERRSRSTWRKKKKKNSLPTFLLLLLLALAPLLGAVRGHRPVVLLADVDVAPAVVVDDEAAWMEKRRESCFFV